MAAIQAVKASAHKMVCLMALCSLAGRCAASRPRRERPCLRAPEPRDELPPSHLRPPEICQQIYHPGCIAVLTADIKSRPDGARRAGLGDWAAACEPKDAMPIARIPAKTVRRIISYPPGGGFRLAISQHCRQTVKAAQDRSSVIWSWRCPERRPE
jgi:hypothetical protein